MIIPTRLRFGLALLAVVVLALACASGARADGDVLWGVSGVTPTLDTANGDHKDSETPGATGACPNGEACGTQVNPLSGTNPILPGPFTGEDTSDAPHSAEDLAVWTSGVTAPTGGQVTEIKLTGCAVEDTNSPTQESQGTPVNTVDFQVLSPSGADWNSEAVAAGFQVPFCNNSVNNDGASASTVTTYQPIHMCVAAGDAVAFHDIGGFVSENGQSFYPQGIPMRVLAPTQGAGTDSFVGGSSTYGPGIYGSGDDTDYSGYASEGDQEVTMQMVEGTGDDAYGLCPGGFGDEPSNSNTIDCDYDVSDDGSNTPNPSKDPDHPWCPGNGPTSSGSGSGSGSSGSGSSGSGSGSKSGTGTTGSGKGSGSSAARVPVITKLRSNPPRFLAKNHTVITWVDSEPGLTTLRFYILRDHKWRLVRTVVHQDRSKAGIHLRGFRPGRYLIRATSVYKGHRSKTYVARFTVVAHR